MLKKGNCCSKGLAKDWLKTRNCYSQKKSEISCEVPLFVVVGWWDHFEALLPSSQKKIIFLMVLTLDGRWVASRRVSLRGPGGEQRSLKDRWRCRSGGRPVRRGHETLQSWAEKMGYQAFLQEHKGGKEKSCYRRLNWAEGKLTSHQEF